jgi:hypothetical protein
MSIYDSIAKDPFLQSAKEELDALNIEIASITRLSVQTTEDKVRKDALIEKWGALHSKYSRAIRSILEGAEA